MSFDAHEERIMDLFNRKVYSVPRNQRRYVWGRDNWQELFDDVMEVVKGTFPAHFIGSIVLKTDDRLNGLPQFSVIDGQQRTITLAVFLVSIMFWMKKSGMDADFNGTVPYIIAKDDKNNDVVMVTAENNGSLENIINAIVNLTDDQAKKATVNSIIDGNLLNKSDINIADVFKFFMNSISDLYEASSKNQQLLINMRNAVRDITFVNITATTEEDSYTIFEILNARGLDLEDHELLKNYIMRYIQPEANRDKAKSEWNRIETILGHSNLKRFVRHYTTHRYGDYRSKSDTSDYKIIQGRNKGKDTWELLKDLEKKATYYLRLVAPNKEGENRNCSDVEFRIYAFFKKKRQEQMRPVLLSLITKYENGELSKKLYEKTIVFLYNYYICYNIIGEENSNRLTNTLYKFAAKINRNCSEEVINAFVDELRKKLPSEKMFINSFMNLGWSHHSNIYEGEKNKIRVQTVLEIIERYHNHGECDNSFTIEHVLPDNESQNNGQIGNLIPLELSLNKKCKDKAIAEKLIIYSESSYCTARNFSIRYSGANFSPEKRTEYMAKEVYKKILGSSGVIVGEKHPLPL